MLGCASWILQAALGGRSWLIPNAINKGGVGIFIYRRYARLVTTHVTLFEHRVVWVKLEGIEGGNIRIACICA
jgi:hypothetical protein